MPEEPLNIQFVQHRLCCTELEIKAHTTLGQLSAAITQAIRQLGTGASGHSRAKAITILRDADARYAAYHDACRKALAG